MGPRICISNKLLDDAHTSGPRTTLWRARNQKTKSEQLSQNSEEEVKEIHMVKEKLKREPRATMELLHVEKNRGVREKGRKLHVCFHCRKAHLSNSAYYSRKAERPHDYFDRWPKSFENIRHSILFLLLLLLTAIRWEQNIFLKWQMYSR